MSEQLEAQAMRVIEAIADGEAPPGTLCRDAYAMSIAISLKRIADVLDEMIRHGAQINVDRRGH